MEEHSAPEPSRISEIPQHEGDNGEASLEQETLEGQPNGHDITDNGSNDENSVKDSILESSSKNVAETNRHDEDSCLPPHDQTDGLASAAATVTATSSPSPAGPRVQENGFVSVQLNDEQQTPEESLSGMPGPCTPTRFLTITGENGTTGRPPSEQEGSSSPSVPSIITVRSRSDTVMSTVSSIPGPQGQQRMSSMFFVVQALETIQNTKEGRRRGHLKDITGKALGSSSFQCF
jgi:hypothetical protein